jgi:hypothetical protein
MTDPLRTLRRALLLASLLAAVSASAAFAAPTTVNLRVEGATQTVFEGPITTDGHDVTTAAGGTHPCDGSNVNTNTSTGPTASSALDDAARLHGFTWDGTFDSGFGDFLISRIASDTIDPSTHYWSLYVNNAFAQSGGCGQRVAAGDEVLWGNSDFVTSQALRLTGPTVTQPGQPITVEVTNGPGGTPQPDAKVGDAVTGADGRAALTFATPGIYRLKAEREASIRSNALSVCVDGADADPCTSGDKTPPVATVNLPAGGVATANFRSRTIVISWQAQDSQADGSGVATYTAEAREVIDGAHASQDQPWRTLLWRSKDTSVPFRGRAGRSYEFRVTAYDRAANASVPAAGRLSFPVDDRNRRILRLSHGWRGVNQAEAYGGRVIKPKKAGVTATMKFSGTHVALVGRTLPKGGRLAVKVDGKRTVLKLRGKSGFRQTLWTSPTLKSGAHVLRLEALGGGPVELDAVAPLP